MPLSVIIAFLVAVFVESLLIGGLVLWFCCRALKVPNVSGRRALGVNLASTAFGYVCQMLLVLIFVCASKIEPAGAVLLLLALSVVGMATQIAFISWLLPAPKLKAFAGWIVTNAAVAGLNLFLAVIAKAALVEAYVVPTGAMAPTILGAHADRVCSHCGYAFTVGLSRRVPAFEDVPIEPLEPILTACPNCRHADTVGVEVPIVGGDRIIADKRNMPGRWELAIHRYPEDRKINFAKRLVGLPGETVEIIAGDVFIDGKRLQKPSAVAQELWLHVNDTAFRSETPEADEPGWRPRNDQSTWREEGGMWIGGDGKSRVAALDYVGPITNFEAYNGGEADYFEAPERNVGDVMAVCDVAELDGAGRFGLQWQFRGDAVKASIAKHGEVEIEVHSHDKQGEPIRDRLTGSLPSPLAPGDRIGFAVRDGQAYVVQNDRVVLLLAFGPQDAASAKQDSREAAEPCHVSLVADQCRVSLSRIVLVRDVYYTGGDVEDFGMRGGRDEPLKLEESEYFALGDNSVLSKDSRFYEDLQAADLKGTARWIYWPKKRWREFR